MEDNVYMPPKPVNQFAPPECGHHPPPPPCPPGWTYPPAPVPPPPPKPPAPGHVCQQPFPGLNTIPPIPSVCEGDSLYEAMNLQIQRTNACIAQWNAISRNCFEAMNACVEAARSNDVYYDDCEVHYQEGYDENEGCAYAIVEKKAVDRNGRPIFVRLVPAYKNSTNSGVKQDIFDVSFIESANLIITAVPTQQQMWYGPAMWKGAPIPGVDQNIMHPIEGQDPMPQLAHPGWVYGFNRQGWLRFFEAKAVTETDLCQNAMVDVLGSCWPILSNGELTEVAQELTTKAAITAIGFNKGTGSVFFFSCSAQDQVGMSGVAVAKLLQGFGCTTAVITAMLEPTDTFEAAGMMYMGQMTTVPNAGRTPENLAYWVISKRPNFTNRFQKEIADLVQTTGQNAWKNYLLGVQIQDFDDRINDNKQMILDEIERAKAAEAQLQENIDAETDRAEQAEAQLQANIDAEQHRAEEAEAQLQANIDAEEARAKAEEARLDAKIDAETNRATAAEAALDQKIVDETHRATAAENQLAADISAERLRAITRENEIQAALDKEIRERVAADNDIINALEQEVLARRAADTALENKIDAVKNELNISINDIQNIVNGITGGQTEMPYLKLTGGTLTGPLTIAGENTVTLGRGPTEDMEAATKKYVDDAIATGGGGSTGGDVSKEYVDQQVSSLQTQLENKVSKSGDTMTGALNMNGQKLSNAVLSSNTGTTVDNGAGGPGTITNLADPVNPTDAVNLQTLQKATEGLGGDYLPTAGGNMTGDINMTGDSTIKFYDTEAIQADLAKPALTPGSIGAIESADQINLTIIRPSAAAKRLGITAELVAQAAQNGLNLKMASNQDVLDSLNLNPHDLPGHTYIGAVYNDDVDMCIQSETGKVNLKGTEIMMTDGAGEDITVMGVKQIGPIGEASIKFGALSTDIIGPVKVTNALGDPTSSIQAGQFKSGVTTIEGHTQGSDPEHLDINVGTSTGAVYINRSNNGQNVAGGTGELHVTEIHAPNELELKPGTSVDLNGHALKGITSLTGASEYQINIQTAGGAMAPVSVGSLKLNKSAGLVTLEPLTTGNALNANKARITNIADGVNAQDAVTVKQLNQVKQTFPSHTSVSIEKVGTYFYNSKGGTINLQVNLSNKDIVVVETSVISPMSYFGSSAINHGIVTKAIVSQYDGNTVVMEVYEASQSRGAVVFDSISMDIQGNVTENPQLKNMQIHATGFNDGNSLVLIDVYVMKNIKQYFTNSPV